MTTTCGTNGRLGNQIIRNLAVSLIAEKHNLKVNYFNNDLIYKLGINLYSGSNIYNNTNILDDNNYFMIYNCSNLNCNLNPNNNYFQTKEIIDLLYNYIQTDNIKSNIIDKNLFKERYNNNNDLYIHIRLGDVIRFNPGIAYYLNTIKLINFNNLYISTDTITHDIIQTILQLYPLAIILDYDEINTIQFGSTCKNIILSHGSFSAIIGYLSFYSNIYYPEYMNIKWHGDLFSIDKWIKCSIN